MKICIAQTKSYKGEVERNIKNHLQLVKKAIAADADLIIFPELSITNYEPQLAESLASYINHPLINSFQDLSDLNAITIGVGMPTHTSLGLNISMIIFQPNQKRIIYSKQILHSDEKPYFVAGETQNIFEIHNTKIAIGICFETLQKEHFINAVKNRADIYIASVAKPKIGINKANAYFSKISKEYNIPILMSNCIGPCDNFESNGQSAIWNRNGKIINQLDDKNEGFLIYDTISETSKTYQLYITKGSASDLDDLFQIYQNAKTELERNGIFQWTNEYPTLSIIKNDLDDGLLYVLKNENKIIGAINISESQEEEYRLINWKYYDSKVLTIHRLVIDPMYQRNGYAKTLMNFAENYAFENQYSSIRLDAYSQNVSVIEFYKKRNYVIRGDTYFPGRELPFHCLEKKIN